MSILYEIDALAECWSSQGTIEGGDFGWTVLVGDVGVPLGYSVRTLPVSINGNSPFAGQPVH